LTIPNLTLVVTAHRIAHLGEALASVEAQLTDEFSLVLVADRLGEPNVGSLMTNFAERWNRSPVRMLSAAGGFAGPVRNAGLAAATTPWVTYLDGDDVLAPGAMDIAGSVAGGDADIYLSGVWHIDGNGDAVAVPTSLTDRPTPNLYFEDPEHVGSCPHLFQLVVMRRAVWSQYPYYEWGPGEDLDFILHQLVRCSVRRIPRVLYGHRRTLDGFSERRRRQALPKEPCSCPCSRRYQEGYYGNLLMQMQPRAEANFSDDFFLSGVPE
jgi:glycosyltransferase involved in cell wall biosynthesis